MKALVASWLEAEKHHWGISQAQAIRSMNETLRTNVTHSRVSEWKKGKYTPSPEVLSYMLYSTLPWVLKTVGLDVSAEQEAQMDRLLWSFEDTSDEQPRDFL